MSIRSSEAPMDTHHMTDAEAERADDRSTSGAYHQELPRDVETVAPPRDAPTPRRHKKLGGSVIAARPAEAVITPVVDVASPERSRKAIADIRENLRIRGEQRAQTKRSLHSPPRVPATEQRSAEIMSPRALMQWARQEAIDSGVTQVVYRDTFGNFVVRAEAQKK